MAAPGWLTPRRRSATARSVLAGEAAAEAARKSSAELAHARSAQSATDASPAPREPEFPVVGDDLAAAFFDLDNTVMQGAALFHFGRGLYKRKFFQRRELARFAWQQTWSTSATRTIKLVVVGTSGRPRVDLDAFVVVK